MTTTAWLLDVVLALALPFLAWRALATRALSTAVVLFIALGLLSALAWARLDAPDIAFVEAAIGAGLTGALLMSALGVPPDKNPSAPGVWWRRQILLISLGGLGLVGLVSALAWAVYTLPVGESGLAPAALAALNDSGVSHPVTAVLLNYRGYDTFLEVVVFMVAAVGVRSLQFAQPAVPSVPVHGEPLLAVLVRSLIPWFILVAGYFLWIGTTAPGGAFQAGAILAGGGVLLLLAGKVRAPGMSTIGERLAFLIGPVFFLIVAGAPVVAGRNLLEYPQAWAGTLIFVVELLLAISIAFALVMFFPGTSLKRHEPRSHEVRFGDGP